jgi:hypothetical protein
MYICILYTSKDKAGESKWRGGEEHENVVVDLFIEHTNRLSFNSSGEEEL